MRKLFDNVKVNQSLDVEAYTGETTGAQVVDTQGFNDGMLVVAAGDITCTTGNSYTIEVMECDTTDGEFVSTGISVVFSGASGALAGQNGTKQARIPELNVARKRYLRADLTCTATTTAWEGGAIILLAGKDSGPVNTD